VTAIPDTREIDLSSIFAMHVIVPNDMHGVLPTMTKVMSALVEAESALSELRKQMHALRDEVKTVMPVIMDILVSLNEGSE